MANVPLVATSIGAEGLHLEHGHGFLLADDAASFAAAIEGLLGDRALWERVANATTDVTERHSEEAVADALFTAFDDVLAREPKPASLPQSSRQQLNRRILYQTAQKLVPDIERTLDRFVPSDATVIVAHEGLQELLRLHGREVLPFPDDAPRTEKDMLAALRRLAREGGDVLVVPSVSLWWNEAFNALQPAIRNDFREIASTEACAVYDLQRRPVELEQLSTNGHGLNAGGAASDALKLIAFYLPQFHPIPENDPWWGQGFTEWRNVANARPPVRRPPPAPPAVDLGFYDLRLPEIREAQADLARAHGIQASATTTTGSQGSSCSSARSRRYSRAGGPTSPSASAGRTNRGRGAGTARTTTSSSRRATARRTTVGTSPGFSRPSRRASDPRRRQAALPRLPGPRAA